MILASHLFVLSYPRERLFLRGVMVRCWQVLSQVTRCNLSAFACLLLGQTVSVPVSLVEQLAVTR
jgi:hypothetical protein